MEKCKYCGTKKPNQQVRPDNNTHVNNGQYGSISKRPSKVLQYFMFLILLIVIIPVSIAECYTKNGLGWGIATIYCVNGSMILWSVYTIIQVVRGNYCNKEKTWRIYYEYVHFPVEVIFVLIGYMILRNYDEIWILLLNFLTGTWPIVGARCIENYPN